MHVTIYNIHVYIGLFLFRLTIIEVNHLQHTLLTQYFQHTPLYARYLDCKLFHSMTMTQSVTLI